jgi:DNA anti-recombination protein RmuC
MSRFTWMLMLAMLFVATGCDQKPAVKMPGKVTSEDVQRDIGQAVNTTAEYSLQSKEEFQKNLKAQLNELDAKIDKLREKGRELKDDAKVNWDKKMADLETKREAARVKLDEVGNSSAEAWKDIQKGAQSAREELEKAFKDASKEF